MHAGGFYTDGARVIRLLKGGDTGRFELLLLNAVTSASAGIRPRDLNKADLNEAVELGNKLNAPMTVYLHLYLHQAALDEEPPPKHGVGVPLLSRRGPVLAVLEGDEGEQGGLVLPAVLLQSSFNSWGLEKTAVD